MVFNEAAMRVLFLAYIKRTKKRYSFAIYNFCVMGNHIHFLIRPDKDCSLSKIMQWLLGNYAKAWNKAHGVKGHLWGDRFYSRITRPGRDFAKTFDYVSLNPVEAQLVVRAEEWEYGGVCHFVKGETGILDIPPLIEVMYGEFIRR
jgi:putative transposase